MSIFLWLRSPSPSPALSGWRLRLRAAEVNGWQLDKRNEKCGEYMRVLLLTPAALALLSSACHRHSRNSNIQRHWPTACRCCFSVDGSCCTVSTVVGLVGEWRQRPEDHLLCRWLRPNQLGRMPPQHHSPLHLPHGGMAAKRPHDPLPDCRGLRSLCQLCRDRICHEACSLRRLQLPPGQER